ncbi:MAG TPA: DUF3857 domain-containing protein [Thermoanaerobaculia bacterium]|jgi:hypothetical protein|nr:DUF3857 domain-containing protein [Thermoanaerobaculia bacterium]
MRQIRPPSLGRTVLSALCAYGLLGALAGPASAAKGKASTLTPAKGRPTATAPQPWDAGYGADAKAVLAAAQAVETADDASVLVLFDEREHSFDAAGRQTVRTRMIYKLLDQDAVEGWSYTEAEWSPWREDRPVIRARVIGPDGREIALDPATLSDSPASEDDADLYGDRRLLRAPLAGAVVGAVVEEEQVVAEHEPFFAAGVQEKEVLARPQPVHEGRLLVDAPSGMPVRWEAQLMPGLAPRSEEAGGRTRLVFEYGALEAADEVEAGLPDDLPRYPAVRFSTGASWQAVAAAYATLVDGRLAGFDRKQLALPASGERETRIEAALRKLQRDVRYTGLELGAASLVPVSPAETLHRRFGDCKDQATLLVAALRAAGIPASVALLGTGPGPDVDTDLPGFAGFDHAIVYVPGPPPLWIDPTDPDSRLGELPEPDQGRLALVADAATTGLLRIPRNGADRNRMVETRAITLAEQGLGSAVETTEYFGSFEGIRRGYQAQADVADRRKRQDDYVRTTYMGSRGKVVESEPRDFSRPFTVRIEVSEAKRAAVDLDEAAVGIPLSGLTSQLPDELLAEDDDAEPRKADFVVGTPHTIEWHYRIKTPPGMVPRDMPADTTRQLGAATLRETFAREGDGLRLDIVFTSGTERLTPEQFEATRKAVVALGKEDPLAVWFEPVEAADLAAGRPREALAKLQALVDGEPKRVIHQVRLSRALLSLGFGEAAQRLAKRATETAPQSSIAQWQLGWALEHDAIGRRFGKGWDRAASLAALDRAAKLDPKSRLARAELAILLQYDDHGTSLGPRADLARMVTEVQAWRKDFDSHALDINLAGGLLLTGRHEELAKLADELEGADKTAWKVTARALREGSEAALREARQLASDKGARSKALTAAAQKLVLVRRYDVAATLMREAANGADEPGTLLARAEVLGRVRPLDEMAAPTADPVALLPRLMRTLAAAKPDSEAFRTLFPPEATAGQQKDFAAFLEGLRAGLESKGNGAPLQVVAELGLASFAVDVDGDAARGYRLRWRTTSPEMSGWTMTFYAAAYDGLPRLVAISTDQAAVAKEVLRRLDGGDLAGARQWLDWAREEVSRTDSADALAGAPFTLLWDQGQGEKEPAPDAAAMRAAVAALLVQGASAVEAVPLLEKALAAAGDGIGKRALQVALVRAKGAAGDFQGALRIAQELAAADPRSFTAFQLLTSNLLGLERLDEVERLITARLALIPDDPETLRVRARVALYRHDSAAAYAVFAQLEPRRAGDAGLYNEWAWAELFDDPVPATAVQRAHKAAELSRFHSYPVLHTLAAAHAAMHQPLEAQRVLMQALALDDDRRQPGGSDWYVLARVAEDYGLDAVARELYQRVLATPRQREPFTSRELAERRLARLPAAKGKAG